MRGLRGARDRHCGASHFARAVWGQKTDPLFSDEKAVSVILGIDTDTLFCYDFVVVVWALLRSLFSGLSLVTIPVFSSGPCYVSCFRAWASL